MLVLKGDYIATDTMLALADELSTNRTLEGLAVGATCPDEEVGPALGEALAVNASLKTVVLEGDLVGDATGLAVAGALKSNRTLINLAVHGDLVGNETGLAMAGVLENAGVPQVGGRNVGRSHEPGLRRGVVRASFAALVFGGVWWVLQ